MNKAYTCKTKDVVEELKLHGCHVTVNNSFEKIEGWTPVHVAAMQGRVDALKYLEKRGCELDVRDKRDETLHLAAANNKLEAAKYLLRRGCSTESRNNIGQTPKDLALRMEYNDIVEALEIVFWKRRRSGNGRKQLISAENESRRPHRIVIQ